MAAKARSHAQSLDAPALLALLKQEDSATKVAEGLGIRQCDAEVIFGWSLLRSA